MAVRRKRRRGNGSRSLCSQVFTLPPFQTAFPSTLLLGGATLEPW